MATSTEELHPQSKIEQVTDDVRSYIITTFDLYRLKLVDKVSAAGGGIAAYFILAVLALLVLILLSIGVAVWLNGVTGSDFAGYFIVAGFYVLCCLVIIGTGYKVIKKPVSSALIKTLLED